MQIQRVTHPPSAYDTETSAGASSSSQEPKAVPDSAAQDKTVAPPLPSGQDAQSRPQPDADQARKKFLATFGHPPHSTGTASKNVGERNAASTTPEAITRLRNRGATSRNRVAPGEKAGGSTSEANASEAWRQGVFVGCDAVRILGKEAAPLQHQSAGGEAVETEAEQSAPASRPPRRFVEMLGPLADIIGHARAAQTDFLQQGTAVPEPAALVGKLLELLGDAESPLDHSPVIGNDSGNDAEEQIGQRHKLTTDLKQLKENLESSGQQDPNALGFYTVMALMAYASETVGLINKHSNPIPWVRNQAQSFSRILSPLLKAAFPNNQDNERINQMVNIAKPAMITPFEFGHVREAMTVPDLVRLSRSSFLATDEVVTTLRTAMRDFLAAHIDHPPPDTSRP